jgi:hypothetical protein
MPGSISDHNASEKSGNTLTWSLPSSGDFNAQATSKLGAGGNAIWWVVGIGSACLCMLLVVAVIVLIIVLVSRNKKKSAANVTIPPQA